MAGQGTPKGGQTGKTDISYSVGISNFQAGCLAFWQFLHRTSKPKSRFPMDLCLAAGSVSWCLMSKQVWAFLLKHLLEMQQLQGVASFSSHGGSLLSSEISLAGQLTRSLLPYLDAFTELFESNYLLSLCFAGKFFQSFWRPGEEYTDAHTHVCIHSLPCRTASLHKCCFHGNKDKILNNGN